MSAVILSMLYKAACKLLSAPGVLLRRDTRHHRPSRRHLDELHHLRLGQPQLPNRQLDLRLPVRQRRQRQRVPALLLRRRTRLGLRPPQRRHHHPSFTATYGGTPTTGAWTHLVGVCDATTNQLTLYVNGRQAGTKAFAGTPWDATGPLQIGRRLASGTYGEYTNARMSDIHVYNTALPPADAAATGDNPAVTQLD
jgi:hypothetical protein